MTNPDLPPGVRGVSAGWRPSAALVRAALVSAVLAAVAAGFGRADVLVLATPFLVHAVAGVVRRPAGAPTASSRLAHQAVREREATTLHVRLVDAADVEHAVVALERMPAIAVRPATGVVGASGNGGSSVDVDVVVSSMRWGHRIIASGVVAANGPWAGHVWGPHPLRGRPLTTLPLPGAYDSRAPVPHPIGLVGTHPARVTGDGSEIASVRRFQVGDKLRRIEWRTSLRSGELHVTSTVAEQDSSILLVVDCGTEVGTSDPVAGTVSSLDVAVRAAGALAEHYLHRGDRVGLRVLGAVRRGVLPLGSGRRHLRRVLDELAWIVPGQRQELDPQRLRLPPGTVVIVLTPLLSEQSVLLVTTLAQRGLDLVVVDTLPADVLDRAATDRDRIAWRMRLLERAALLGRVRRAGVPVASWSGPGTLDEVLRGLGRRARQPRTVRR
jgi:uncharacterized protein (DUF58 family)